MVKLIFYHDIFGDKIVNNPKFIPRVGEMVTFNRNHSPKITQIVHTYGDVHVVHLSTE